MLVGNDISNYQGQIDWPTYIRNSNFVICKSSEGTSYIDTWFGYNRSQARLFNILRGWYHFARPDTGNSPEAEATFFCNLMDGDPLEQGEIVALDFEVTYHDPVNWCKRWLDLVSQKLGVKPLIYLNQSLATSYDWSPVVNAGYGLWIAAYTYDPGNNQFKTGAWEFAAMQQWTDQQQVPGTTSNLDGDVFFGDAAAFKKYGLQPAPEPQVISTPAIPINTTNGPATATLTPETPSPSIVSVAVTTPQVPEVNQQLEESLNKAKQATKFNLFTWLKSVIAYIFS